MKAKSICLIREILTKKRDVAKGQYEYVRGFLQNKYDTVWTDSAATERELEELHVAKLKYECLEELLEDFENHQWQ